MSIVNSEVILEGTDISNIVISYKREQNICTGIGTVTLETVDSISPDPWDLVKVYENGNKVGEYYISEEDRGLKSGTKTIKCQDSTKKLQAYFVDNSFSYANATTSRYWLERFFSDAGVDYEITADDDGSIIAPDTPFGMSSAYDLIYSLLQISGWYMYINTDGVAVVGKLDVGSSQQTFDDSNTLELITTTNDRMSRNSVVVWGNNDPVEHVSVFARITQTTDWQIDEDDVRTIVLANDKIRSLSTAQSLAETMLDEFNTLTEEITIKAAGYYGLSLGDVVTVDSQFLSDSGKITTLITECSEKGMITTLVLEQRCPRLVGYYSTGGGIYVYIGTSTAGVWRKTLTGSIWHDFSTGLEYLDVSDLAITSNTMACVAGGKLYVNLSHAVDAWQEVIITEASDGETTYTSSELEFVACDISKTNGNIYAAMKLRSALSGQRSWVVEVSPALAIINSGRIFLGDETLINIEVHDIEEYNGDIIVTVKCAFSYAEDFVSTWLNESMRDVDTRSTTISIIPSAATDSTVQMYSYQMWGQTTVEGNVAFNVGNTGALLYLYSPPLSDDVTVLGSYGDPNDEWYDAFVVDNNPNWSAFYRVKEDSNTEWRAAIIGDAYFSIVTIGDLIEPPIQCDEEFMYCATTTNITLNGLQTVDGMELYEWDLVLVKDQFDPRENGVYYAKESDWERIEDDLVHGMWVFVEEGDENMYTLWQVSTLDPISVGVTSIAFIQSLKETYSEREVLFG